MKSEPLIRPLHEYAAADVAELLARHDPITHHSEQAERRAAVAVILRDNDEGHVEMLFVKRAEHPLDPWSGHMAFPGGHQDPGDKTLLEAACRETFEEVGLSITPEMKIGRLDDLGGGRLGAYNMSVSPFVFHFEGEPRLKLERGEIDDAVWVSLPYLGEPSNIKPYYYESDPENRAFPSYQVDDRYTIWGMTFRMVGSFLACFGVHIPAEGEPTDVE